MTSTPGLNVHASDEVNRVFAVKWLYPVVGLRRVWRGIRGYLQYWRDWRAYSTIAHSEPLSLRDAYPCLLDRTPTIVFDRHYFYQDIWAFKAIRASSPPRHVDVGSRAIFVGMLTAITKVTFVDIRPLFANLENLDSQRGSILALPFDDNSVFSLSCLHVAEHIGLGRYGDALDPMGTEKATSELARLLAPQGNLYFSIPVGRPRVCFNAHRIHSPQQILNYFRDLQLLEFSGIDDCGTYREDIDPNELAGSSYACGLFHFTKNLRI